MKREKQLQAPGADGTGGKVDSLANRKHHSQP
jgi:hypothetical protein